VQADEKVKNAAAQSRRPGCSAVATAEGGIGQGLQPPAQT